MFRLLSFILCVSLSHGQIVPYGPTPATFGRTPVPGPFTPGIPGIPPIAPTVFPFGPTPRPLVPGAYNNPYYNGVSAGGPAVPIVTYSSDHDGKGTYSFSFSTADGKQVQENGYLKDAYIDNAGEPQGTQVVQGSYAYISPDGTPVQVSYIADENGFRPSGVHIPASGKGLLPFPAVVDARKDGRPYDPYNPYNNRYDPFNRNRFNGQLNRPYDPRYPYDPARYNNFNQFRPFGNGYAPFSNGKNGKEEQNKESA